MICLHSAARASPLFVWCSCLLTFYDVALFVFSNFTLRVFVEDHLYLFKLINFPVDVFSFMILLAFRSSRLCWERAGLTEMEDMHYYIAPLFYLNLPPHGTWLKKMKQCIPLVLPSSTYLKREAPPKTLSSKMIRLRAVIVPLTHATRESCTQTNRLCFAQACHILLPWC